MKKDPQKEKKAMIKGILISTAVRATLYAVFIAFLANVAEAIPFEYNARIAALPTRTQTILFFIVAFLLFFILVAGVNLLRIKQGKVPLQSKKKRWF